MKRRILYGLLGCWFAACQHDRDEEKLFTSLEGQQTGITFSNTATETDTLNINSYLCAHNGGGVAVGDINQDGLPGLYFTWNQVPNKLFLTRGGFSFEDITDQAGVAGLQGPASWTTGAVMADVNGDGWLDICVCQISGFNGFQGHNQLFINS